MTLPQGIHFDVPSAVYFADPCEQPSLTQSIAKILIEKSPLHAWHEHPRLGAKAPEDAEPEKYEAAQAIGNAAHKLMIGRGKEIEVVDLDSWRGKAADQRREIEAAGRVAILQKHFVRARNMVEVARERLTDMGVNAFVEGEGHGEVCIAWQEHGLWFRSMIDWLRTNLKMLVDYKTTAMSCAPHAIPALMLAGGWDIQAAMHERGLDVLDPENVGRRRFHFLAQENYEPYALTMCRLPEAVLAMGRKKLDVAISLWSASVASDRWPSYPPTICMPEYPSWAESKWLNREIQDAARERHPNDRDASNLMAG